MSMLHPDNPKSPYCLPRFFYFFVGDNVTSLLVMVQFSLMRSCPTALFNVRLFIFFFPLNLLLIHFERLWKPQPLLETLQLHYS